jgi:hypothetical protein
VIVVVWPPPFYSYLCRHWQISTNLIFECLWKNIPSSPLWGIFTLRREYIMYGDTRRYLPVVSDIGRIYIYQRIFISYILSKNRKKDIPLLLFWAGYVEGYSILILGISNFNILSYILLRKNGQFWGTFAWQNAFFLLNTEIKCEFPLTK